MWVKELASVIDRVRNVLEAVSRGEYCCLRHGLPYVTPSLLAAQAFCEARLDFQLARGEVEAPKPSDARVLVEALLRARRIIPREPPKDGRLVLSVPLAAVIDGVAVVGRPHAVVVSSRGLEYIVAGKISSRPGRVYETDRVKLYAYMQLTVGAGFRVHSGAKLVLVAARSAKSLAEALNTIAREGVKPLMVGDGEAYVHVLAHDPQAEVETLSYLLAYWRGLREPRPRPGRWCSSCPFRSLCPLRLGLDNELDYPAYEHRVG